MQGLPRREAVGAWGGSGKGGDATSGWAGSALHTSTWP